MQKIIILTVALALAGCGKERVIETLNSTSIKDGATIKDSDKNVVAYVLSVGQDQATIYAPDLSQYMIVTLSTGQYYPTTIYYSAAGCTGSMAAVYFGEVGKSVIYNNSKYYVINSNVASFAYQSFHNGTGCTNSTFTLNTPVGVPVEISQPKSFTSLAPMSVSYE